MMELILQDRCALLHGLFGNSINHFVSARLLAQVDTQIVVLRNQTGTQKWALTLVYTTLYVVFYLLTQQSVSAQ